MATNSRYAYVQARLQARHGRRPTDDRWRLLEATPDLAAYLQGARDTSLRTWVVHLPATADAHRIEQSIRRDWSRYVAEISGWAPPAWDAGIDWMATLPYLSSVTHLARGGLVPGWMRDDPVLAPLASDDPEQRAEGLAASPLADVAAAIRQGAQPVDAWLRAWADTWPRADAGCEVLERIRAAYRTHAAIILADPLSQPVGPGLRARLAARLVGTFRRHSGQIGAVIAHVGLMALDVERLRGGLVLRALFPDAATRPLWA